MRDEALTVCIRLARGGGGGAFDVKGVELKGNDKAAALTAQRDPTCSLGNGIEGSASADCVHRERVLGIS